jgi:hypothetical protein
MRPKKIAILQSNYVPWKGYFDLIAAVDEFILYDDMQYTRRDWRNRNLIKTPVGLKWITVPVNVKGKYHQKIRDTMISDPLWNEKHWSVLSNNYRKAPYFSELSKILKPLYIESSYSNISQLNRRFIEVICNYLGIKTIISDSSDYSLIEGKTERLVDLCEQAAGQVYISGLSAKSYIEEKKFIDKGIELAWIDYSDYAEYPQLWGEFAHNVSILDMLFNCGQKTALYMRNVQN